MSKLSDKDVAAFVDSVVTKLNSNLVLEIKADWHLNDQPASTAKVSVGVPKFAEDGSLVVFWDGDVANEFDFPHAAVSYRRLDISKEVPAMPGRRKPKDIQPEGPTQPVDFRFYDVLTWGSFVTADDPNIEHVLEAKLRHEFGVSSNASGVKSRHLECLMQWFRAAREMEGWDAGAFARLGSMCVALTRDVGAQEGGADLEALHGELHAVHHPGDKYGIALAKVLEKSQKGTGAQARKKKVKCFNCQEFGHYSNKCKNPRKPRNDGGTAGLNANAPSFHGRGSGSPQSK